MMSSKPAERTSGAWLCALTRQEPHAWGDLLQHLSGWIYTYAVKRLGWMDVAMRQEFVENCLQEASLRIFRELHQYGGKGEFLGWCRVVALHVVLDRVRTEARHRQQTPVNLHGDVPSTATDLADVEMKAVRQQILACVDQGMETVLSEDERAVFKAGADGSVPQLAAQLNTTNNNIYQLRNRARRKVAKHLADNGYTRQKLQEWGII